MYIHWCAEDEFKLMSRTFNHVYKLEQNTIRFIKECDRQVQQNIMQRLWKNFNFPKFKVFATNPAPGLLNLLSIPLDEKKRFGRVAYKMIDQLEQDLIKIQRMLSLHVLKFLAVF
jgi:hypothetical protein